MGGKEDPDGTDHKILNYEEKDYTPSYDKIDIATLRVEIPTGCQRAVQVEPGEILAQDRLYLLQEDLQRLVDFRIERGCNHFIGCRHALSHIAPPR